MTDVLQQDLTAGTPHNQDQPQRLFNRNFLLQWQGQTVSRFGSQVFSIAMVFWIKRATESASLMGLISLVAGLPAILLMPVGGALADRFRRKRIIVFGDLLRGLAVTGLAFLIYARPQDTALILAALFVVAIFNGIVGAFFGPAIAATIPDLVPIDRVNAANSMGQLSIQASVFIGQGLGGVLFRLLGTPVLFLLNGLSFLYASVSEMFVRIPQVVPERHGDWRAQTRAFRDDLVEGMRYVWHRPGLRELVLLSAVLSFFTAPLVILLPFYVEDFLKARPDWYGFILAAFGVGTLLGYLAAGVMPLQGYTRSRALIFFTLVTAVSYGLLGVVIRPMAALGFAVVGGFATGFVTVNITTLVQVTTPGEIRGRVVGLLAALSSSLTPIAMGLAGLVADLVGQDIPLIYLASGLIMTAAAIAISSGQPFRDILATDLDRGSQAPGATPAALPSTANLAQAAPANPGSDTSAGPRPAVNPGSGPGRRPPDAADPDQRSLEVYEHIAAYPQPPLVPLPTRADFDGILAEMGQPRGSLPRRISDATFKITGFWPFLAMLPENIERLQRQHNLRLPGLQAPVISATLALLDDPRPMTPLTRAATLILGVRSFYKDLFAGTLPPDNYKGHPLEMGQYPNFFSTSQVLDGRGARLYKSRHVSTINVMVGGRFYLLDIGELGAEPSVAALEAALGEIVRRAAEEPRQPGEQSPGILTCATTPVQLRAFARLHQMEVNRQSLHALRHTFFTLCLDLDEQPTTPAEAALIGHSKHQENRWMHASLQVVVFGNAVACGLCNFTAYLDGNVMMRGAAEIQRRAAAVPLTKEPAEPEPPLPPATRLAWQIPDPAIQAAKHDLAAMLDDQPATFEIPGFGQTFFADHGVAAVPTFILALQMTANRLTSQPVQITQFLSMSRYRCTDLTTAVVSGPQVQRFADAMIGADGPPSDAKALLKAAIEEQAEIARQHRRFLPLSIIFHYFVRSRQGLRQPLTALFFRLRLMTLVKLKALPSMEREVLVSHPEIYPEVPIVGRPGVRLPYVKYFGLHYQIMADKIVITMMPGQRWQVPNAQLIADLTDSLDRIRRALEETPA